MKSYLFSWTNKTSPTDDLSDLESKILLSNPEVVPFEVEILALKAKNEQTNKPNSKTQFYIVKFPLENRICIVSGMSEDNVVVGSLELETIFLNTTDLAVKNIWKCAGHSVFICEVQANFGYLSRGQAGKPVLEVVVEDNFDYIRVQEICENLIPTESLTISGEVLANGGGLKVSGNNAVYESKAIENLANRAQQWVNIISQTSVLR